MNLQDHPTAGVTFFCQDESSLKDALNEANLAQWMQGQGPLTSNIGENGGFARTRDGLEAPDVQFHMVPVVFEQEGLLAPQSAPSAVFDSILGGVHPLARLAAERPEQPEGEPLADPIDMPDQISRREIGAKRDLRPRSRRQSRGKGLELPNLLGQKRPLPGEDIGAEQPGRNQSERRFRCLAVEVELEPGRAEEGAYEISKRLVVEGAAGDLHRLDPGGAELPPRRFGAVRQR